jgi:hypothetical protein
MNNIPLSEIKLAAKSRPASYLQEALKRGTIKDNCLQLSNEDCSFLKNLSSGSTSVETKDKVEKLDQKVEVKVESESTGEVSDNVVETPVEKTDGKCVIYQVSNEKQSRVGRAKID